MSFGGLILTNDGRNEIAKAELGQTFLVTNVILGDGFYSGSYNAVASLVNPVMTLPIGKIERKESEVWLEIEFSSKDVPKAFYLREVGIIANGKLCYYDNSGDDAEFINPDAANLIQQKRMRFILLVSQECQVNVSVNSSLYALEDDFENAVDELEKKKVNISGGDISDTVATLDETAGDVTDNIASGESLRTILSKIYKVIRQFFNHKTDTVIHTTKADKDKLAGIEEHANNYVHPDTHPAGMITSDANHRFVTDDKIVAWDNSLSASKTYADGMYRQATAYADKKVADLIGGAPESLDTLKEVADAIKENESVMDALDAAVGKKANQSELDTHVDNSTIHITSQEREKWNGSVSKTGDASNTTVTFTESTRVKPTSGEKLSTIVGKIVKWLADLKTVAFSGSYNDLNNIPSTFNPAAHTHGGIDDGAHSWTATEIYDYIKDLQKKLSNNTLAIVWDGKSLRLSNYIGGNMIGYTLMSYNDNTFYSVNKITIFKDSDNILFSGEKGNFIVGVSVFSDARLKKNVNRSKLNAIECINEIEMCEYDFIDEKYGEHSNLGYIAQQLQKVIPECVVAVPQDKEQMGYDELLQVQDTYLIPYLVKAIQELSSKVAELEKKIDGRGKL